MICMEEHINFGIFMKYVVTCATLVLIAKFAFETLQVYIKTRGAKKEEHDPDDICGRKP